MAPNALAQGIAIKKLDNVRKGIIKLGMVPIDECCANKNSSAGDMPGCDATSNK